MAGSTGPNARMEKLTSNVNTPCPEGQVRNKSTGACEDKPAKPVEEAIVTYDKKTTRKIKDKKKRREQRRTNRQNK